MALSDLTRDASWLSNLLMELQLPISPATTQVPIHMDSISLGTKAMAETDVTTQWAKHIDLCYHYSHEKVHDRFITIHACASKDQAADGLTKPLQKDPFNHFLHLNSLT